MKQTLGVLALLAFAGAAQAAPSNVKVLSCQTGDAIGDIQAVYTLGEATGSRVAMSGKVIVTYQNDESVKFDLGTEIFESEKQALKKLNTARAEVGTSSESNQFGGATSSAVLLVIEKSGATSPAKFALNGTVFEMKNCEVR